MRSLSEEAMRVWLSAIMNVRVGRPKQHRSQELVPYAPMHISELAMISILTILVNFVILLTEDSKLIDFIEMDKAPNTTTNSHSTALILSLMFGEFLKFFLASITIEINTLLRIGAFLRFS